MRFISLLVGKTILRALRILGRSGSALPGYVVEKMHPGFLRQMLTALPHGAVVVTGTNGKTTTTKAITSLLEAQGLRVLTNKTGSNFVRGIVTTVIDKARLSGRLPYDIAVIEQDEAHAVHFVHQVPPRGVIVLNIMRDQMDRFGEIDTTARFLQEVVSAATEWVVLNANDERVSKLHVEDRIKTYWFGHDKELQNSFLTDDELHHQDDTTYVRAGEPTYELTAYDAESVSFRRNGHMEQYQTSLRGSHNAINIMAALTAVTATAHGADPEKIKQAVEQLHPAFGRGESFQTKSGVTVLLQLVKNPGGFTHGLRMLDLQKYGVVAVAINDDYADGRDVSWLWDVDFNRLKNGDSMVICGGARGNDMAVRLKYDGVTTEQVHVSLSQLVRSVNTAALQKDKTVIIFCTYTAMLKIRRLYKHYSREVYGVRV